MPANSPPVSLSADKRRLGLALLAGGPITHERLLLELDRSGKSGSDTLTSFTAASNLHCRPPSCSSPRSTSGHAVRQRLKPFPSTT